MLVLNVMVPDSAGPNFHGRGGASARVQPQEGLSRNTVIGLVATLVTLNETNPLVSVGDTNTSLAIASKESVFGNAPNSAKGIRKRHRSNLIDIGNQLSIDGCLSSGSTTIRSSQSSNVENLRLTMGGVWSFVRESPRKLSEVTWTVGNKQQEDKKS